MRKLFKTVFFRKYDYEDYEIGIFLGRRGGKLYVIFKKTIIVADEVLNFKK